jgi:hypothetical protein
LVSAVCQVLMPIAFALEQFGPDVSVEKLISRSTYLELVNSCKECTVVSKLPGPHPRVEQEGTVSERFQRLAAEWKEQTRILSNSAQMAMLKPYQRLLGWVRRSSRLSWTNCAASRISGSGLWNPSRNRTQCRLTVNILRRPRYSLWIGTM